MPEISIILPAFNAGKYLGECLESVTRQTFQDFEIIIIDDGSTDETNCIALRWCKKDKRIRLIKSNGKGVSSARNSGLEIAEGRFISFLDSDDLLSPVMLKTLILLQKSNNCQCAAVSYTSNFDEICTGKDYGGENIIEIPETYRLLTHDKLNIGGYVWNKLYITDIVKKNHIRFDEQIASGEDLLFNFNYLKYVTKIVYCKSKMYYYRLSEASSVNRLDNAKWFDILFVHQTIMESNMPPKVLEYFSYDYAQLILEAIYRTKCCTADIYTYEDLLALKKQYVKFNLKWGFKSNIKVGLFLICPKLAMKYRRRCIKE